MIHQLRFYRGGFCSLKNVPLSRKAFPLISISRAFSDNLGASENNREYKEVEFYKVSNAKIIRAMLAGTGINALYWGTNGIITLTKSISARVPFGIDFFVGSEVDFFLFAVSGAMVYLTTVYGKYSVYRCFETADGQKLGLQVHNALGFPGITYEIPIGNARIVPSRTLGTVCIGVDGFGKNFVFTDEKEFYHIPRLQELLNKPRDDVSKEQRIAWRENAHRRKGHNNRKK